MDKAHGTTLLDCLRQLPDPRCQRGRRYEWSFLATLLLAALVQDPGVVRAMAEWVANHAEELCAWLGVCPPRMPSLSALQRAAAQLDLAALRRCLQELSEDLRTALEATLEPLADGTLKVWALDGKAVRGAARRGQPIRLVTLFDQATGVPVDQVSVGDGGEEIPGGQEVLRGKDLRGVLVTGDALHCQRKTCGQVVAQGGHYLIAVRCNQPELQQEIERVFTPPPAAWDPVRDRWEERRDGHGRLERRSLEVSAEVAWLARRGAGPATGVLAVRPGHEARPAVRQLWPHEPAGGGRGCGAVAGLLAPALVD